MCANARRSEVSAAGGVPGSSRARVRNAGVTVEGVGEVKILTCVVGR
jgi:hypothetical protein